MYDRIAGHGGRTIANCAPVSAEIIAAGVRAGTQATVNFVETGSAINRLRWGQLYTPISLAKPPGLPGKPNDVDPRYANVTGWPVSNLYAALDFGSLVFMYDRMVPNVTGWRDPAIRTNVMAHTFPITPQILGPGFIVGCERVVTKTQGTFALPSSELCAAKRAPVMASASGALCVREFDLAGWQIAVRRRVPTPASVVDIGSSGKAAFAVVVPDDDCAGK